MDVNSSSVAFSGPAPYAAQQDQSARQAAKQDRNEASYAKAEGFVPGGASLHNCMSGHGPDAETFEKASNGDTTKPHKVDATMAFMFETPAVIRPTRFAAESAQLVGGDTDRDAAALSRLAQFDRAIAEADKL